MAENLVLEHLLLDNCAGYIVTGQCIALSTRRVPMNTINTILNVVDGG